MKQGVFEIGVCRQTLVARFKIQGNLRFLSHAETTRLIRRALIRSGVELYYSEGFNPQPRLSLPLPRSVAVASEGELFCAAIFCADDEGSGICDKLKSDINNQLPADCRLSSVKIFNGKISPKAVSAMYCFPVEAVQMNKVFRDNVKYLNQNIAAATPIVIDRTIDAKGRTRQVDVCRFVESVDVDEDGITAKCVISNAGTIRPTEILKLLELDCSTLSGPIRRCLVKWKMN